jgi:hypothetical protein
MTGYINVMLVLQSCSGSVHILAGSSSETNAEPDVVRNFSNTEVEEGEGIDVIEEVSISMNEEVDIGIKQEEIPRDITFPDIKCEPDEVSYVCICLLLDTFYQCPAILVFFCDVTISGQLKLLHSWEYFFYLVCRWEGLY